MERAISFDIDQFGGQMDLNPETPGVESPEALDKLPKAPVFGRIAARRNMFRNDISP
ncbi:MAG: hypothetical protein PW843_13470 [Azospirillaceae bacterium]|nr:hypothetical protein [Azospirillaceae bacterium]